MKLFWKLVFVLIGCVATAGLPVNASAESQQVGIVIMHGKGGSPSVHVAGLASALKNHGYLVANLEMPWSGRRDYDVDVSAAEKEVEAALSALRSEGAQQLFVAGHSQGGAFALHLAGRLEMDGVICIAPGGNVGSKKFRDELGSSVEQARELIAAGKGGEKARLDDYEGKKGNYPVVTTPEIYLTWFDPNGAMNSKRAVEAVNPNIPILWLVAKRDYPGLRKMNIPMFDTLPKNPRTRLVEPDSDHAGAPSAAREVIVRWITEIIHTE